MQVDEKTLRTIQRLARRQAVRYISHASPRFYSRALFDVDDLTSVAIIAALKILPQYDPSKGSLFSFLYARMRGAIKDEFRLYSHSRCDRLNRGYRDYQTVRFNALADALADDTMSVEELLPAEDAPVMLDVREELEKVMRGLSKQEKLVLMLRYGQEMPMSVVGEALGLSESRVSQLITGLKKRFDLPKMSNQMTNPSHRSRVHR